MVQQRLQEAAGARWTRHASAALGWGLAAEPAQQAALAPRRQPQHLSRVLRGCEWGMHAGGVNGRPRNADGHRPLGSPDSQTSCADTLPIQPSVTQPDDSPPPQWRAAGTSRGAGCGGAPRPAPLRRRRAAARWWPAALAAACPAAQACCRCYLERAGARLARPPSLQARRCSADVSVTLANVRPALSICRAGLRKCCKRRTWLQGGLCERGRNMHAVRAVPAVSAPNGLLACAMRWDRL